MTLFQVALPSILDYLLELKRSGPLLSLLRLHLLSLYAWNSQEEIFFMLILPTLWGSLNDPCSQSLLWLRSRSFSEMSVWITYVLQPVSTYPLFYFYKEADSCLHVYIILAKRKGEIQGLVVDH